MCQDLLLENESSDFEAVWCSLTQVLSPGASLVRCLMQCNTWATLSSGCRQRHFWRNDRTRTRLHFQEPRLFKRKNKHVQNCAYATIYFAPVVYFTHYFYFTNREPVGQCTRPIMGTTEESMVFKIRSLCGDFGQILHATITCRN